MGQRLNSGRILIVEDEHLIITALEQAFGESGFHADAAANCTEAILLVASEVNEYRVAIVDVGLSEGGGDALCDALRRMRPNLPTMRSRISVSRSPWPSFIAWPVSSCRCCGVALWRSVSPMA